MCWCLDMWPWLNIRREKHASKEWDPFVNYPKRRFRWHVVTFHRVCGSTITMFLYTNHMQSTKQPTRLCNELYVLYECIKNTVHNGKYIYILAIVVEIIYIYNFIIFNHFTSEYLLFIILVKLISNCIWVNLKVYKYERISWIYLRFTNHFLKYSNTN